MWKELLLCVCVVTAYIMAAPAAQEKTHSRSKRVPVPAFIAVAASDVGENADDTVGKAQDEQPDRSKRAVPAFVSKAAEDVGAKVVEKLGDKIADGVVTDHQEKVVKSLQDYFSGQFDKADTVFENVLAKSGNLLQGIGGDVKQAKVQVLHGRGENTGDTYSPPGYELRMDFERTDESAGGKDSSDGMKPNVFPMGVGPVLMNGCFGTNYTMGDPCFEAFVPIEACAHPVDGITFIGVGFDGRGAYSTDSRKKSLIQRSCKSLQGYKDQHVPDTMTIQGIYDTMVNLWFFFNEQEFTHYLTDMSGVTAANGMFQQEINKAQGHFAMGGMFGLMWSGGAGASKQKGSSTQTSNFEASSSASAQRTATSTRTFIAMLELNIYRYEMFLDFVTPGDLNLAFLRDYLDLPGTYFAINAEKAFQRFILRWGTHFITSAKFGGQLKYVKSKKATAEDSEERFATAAQDDMKRTFATFSAEQSQTKSASWWHDQENKSEKNKQSGASTAATSSQSTSQEQSQLSKYEFSHTNIEVQGGDEDVATLLANEYTTKIGDTLMEWLHSIKEYPKAFEFTMEDITDLLDMNFDSLFPHGVVDFGCFGRKNLNKTKTGRQYYVMDKKDAKNTTSEIRYCNYKVKEDLDKALSERRMALKRAIAVYLAEGTSLTSDFQIPGGDPGCTTAELVLLKDSSVGAPNWQDMTSGNEFRVVFDLPFNIPHFITAKADLHVRFVSSMDRWLTFWEGVTPHLHDGHKNGNSGDITKKKVSVGGLVMTYDEASSTFTVTQEDYDASAQVISDLPAWVNGLPVARAEYASLLERLKNQQNPTTGQMPCNLQWSNAHRIDPTDGGKCIRFTAASEGDIFLVFASVPKKHESWLTVEISTSGVAIYMGMRFVVAQLEEGAQSLGSATLYQTYFVCITEDLTKKLTTVQYGKTPDNQVKGHMYLDYQFPFVRTMGFYAFGSGEQPVKLMGVSQMEKPTGMNIVCREGTTREGDRCAQVCHAECNGCRTTGSDDPRDCIACKNVKVPYPYVSGSVGNFQCAATCPAGMAQTAGTNNCKCIKRMEELAADGTVTCVADCPLTHYEDNSVCKRCSSFCKETSGTRKCSGPAVGDCAACIYKAAGGGCLPGCNPGQKATRRVCSIANYVSFNGVCYKDFAEEKTHADAKQTCAADGGQLAMPKSSEINTYLGNMKKGWRWFGLSDAHSEGKWTFDDGTSLESTGFSNWHDGEPNNAGNDEDCAEISSTGSKWNDLPCTATKGFICQMSEQNTISCESCRAGYKCVKGDEAEEICPPGTRSNAAGTACDPCPVGQFSGVAGSATCQPCPAGEYVATSGSSSCRSCPAGQYTATEGSTSCQSCPAGKYTTSEGSASCQTCPAGEYSTTEGSTSCQSCPAGQYSPNQGSTANTCQSCPAGKYSAAEGSASCESCPAGQYVATEGSTSCHRCPAGRYSATEGASSCQTCPVGKYSATEGSTSCQNCPAGKYSATGGATSCHSCPAGQYSSGGGSTSCQTCPAGQHSTTRGSTSCQPCPHGSSSVVDGTRCTHIRLVGGSSRSEGKVEVYHNGKWGTVCDDDFDLKDANVICRQLGFRRALEARQGRGTISGTPQGTVWLDNLACSGLEADISSCGSNGWGVHDCKPIEEDASVVCLSGTDPVGLWPLNSQHGASDITGNGNSGVATGTQLTQGPFGDDNGAFLFSGTANSYINIPNNGKLDVRYAYTMLAHIYPTGNAGPIFDYSATVETYHGWGVHFWQTSAGLFMRPIGRDGTAPLSVESAVLHKNTWNYVGATFDTITGTAAVWINGEQVGQKQLAVPEVASQFPVRVAKKEGDNRIFAGRIACLQLYSYVMTRDEIAAARRKCFAG